MTLSWDDFKSKKISNDQELIQSDPTSCPQNQKGNNLIRLSYNIRGNFSEKCEFRIKIPCQ